MYIDKHKHVHELVRTKSLIGRMLNDTICITKMYGKDHHLINFTCSFKPFINSCLKKHEK